MEFKADVVAAVRGFRNDPGLPEFERSFDAIWPVIIASFKKSVGRAQPAL